MSTKRIVHMCLSVRGAIYSGEWQHAMVGACKDGDRVLTADEILDALCDHLAQGHEVIPFGEPCEGWSWTDGCPGHDVEGSE